MAIRSFADNETEDFYFTGKSSHRVGWGRVSSIVRRKLDQLNAAKHLTDLRAPPNNKLEALKGNLEGLYSIRVNDQWRVVFEWTDQGPAKVQVIDYHS